MSRPRRIALVLAALGAGYCGYLLVGFLRVIADNRLPWDAEAQFTREHYLAVGEAYGQGFAVGFFFCFCLAAMALLVGTWYEETRRKTVPVKAAVPAFQDAGQGGA